jgi:hypothetical protein
MPQVPIDPVEFAAEDFLKPPIRQRNENDALRRAHMLQDPRFASAYKKIECIWNGVGEIASRPDFLSVQERAPPCARRAKRRRYTIRSMSKAPKDNRTPAEKARATARIVGSLKHEGYVPTAEAEAVHQRVARGEITSEEAIEIFRERALKIDAELNARKRPERV